VLERILRYKPHTLSPGEEKLLAMQANVRRVEQHLPPTEQRRSQIRLVKNEKGEEVERATRFSTFLHSPSRKVRQAAFHQYYSQFKAHENTLAATLAGSIQRDVYYAKARSYPSAAKVRCFPTTCRSRCTTIWSRRFARTCRRSSLLRSPQAEDEAERDPPLRHLRADLERTRRPAYLESGGEDVIDSLAPSKRVLQRARRRPDGRWCDRYENQGKQSGAFSSGSYDSIPYI